jgi:predicted nucleic acid-binding protein
VILLDTSGLLAAIDSSQRWHAECAQALVAATPPLLLSPFVLAELDHLISTRVGEDARDSLLGEVARGAYRLEPFAAADAERVRAVIRRHRELQMTLADASLVVLAERHGARDVLTLDERHFRALTLGGRRFRLAPGDG